MKRRLPKFGIASIPAGHSDRQIFSGALLYRAELIPNAHAWLVWEPGPGAERYFNVRLGWSLSAERFPCVPEHDPRIYSLRGPDAMFDAASLDLEQIEGKAAIGGITIPSPWDQLLVVKATAPKSELDAAMRKAHTEASVLTKEARADVVALTVIDVFNRIEAALPAFEFSLLEMSNATRNDARTTSHA